MRVVNHPVMKKDAMALVTGKPVFMDDLVPEGALLIKVKRSPHAHALIEEIDVSRALKVPGIEAVYTYKDVPNLRFHGRADLPGAKPLRPSDPGPSPSVCGRCCGDRGRNG